MEGGETHQLKFLGLWRGVVTVNWCLSRYHDRHARTSVHTARNLSAVWAESEAFRFSKMPPYKSAVSNRVASRLTNLVTDLAERVGVTVTL
jgi:hypothetical protein